MNPIFSVFLGEKLDRLQAPSIAVAAVAVVMLAFEACAAPLASVGLTLSWAIYALFKRSLPIGPSQGFMFEVLILLPLGLGYVLYLPATGMGVFGATSADTLPLLGTGLATAEPLIFYANGAKELRLSTIAVLQYIAPTMIFLIAEFLISLFRKRRC